MHDYKESRHNWRLDIYRSLPQKHMCFWPLAIAPAKYLILSFDVAIKVTPIVMRSIPCFAVYKQTNQFKFNIFRNLSNTPYRMHVRRSRKDLSHWRELFPTWVGTNLLLKHFSKESAFQPLVITGKFYLIPGRHMCHSYASAWEIVEKNLHSIFTNQSSSSFERVVEIHCLVALDLGAGVEQPFDCFIIQNRLNGLDIRGQHG